MTTLLRRLPITVEEGTLSAPDGPVAVYQYQIVVWVSVLRGSLSPRFPALLDTGHSHNFSLSERHFKDWLQGEGNPIGYSMIGNVLVPRYSGSLALYRNIARSYEPTDDFTMLDLPGGLAVHAGEQPRLPLVGLRGLVRNRLKLTIDGKRNEVTLTKGWW